MEPKLGASSKQGQQVERVCTRVCTTSLDWPHPIDVRHLDQRGCDGGGAKMHLIKSR